MTMMIRFSMAMMLLFPIGCSLGGEGEEAGDVGHAKNAIEPPAANAKSAPERVLNQFRVAGGEVTFAEYGSGDSTLVLMQETAPASQSQFPSDLVSERHGILTHLEMFYALAGEDATPDRRLVELHEEQARAMGRSELAVKLVGYYGQQVIKKSAATCSDYAYPDYIDASWGDKASKDNVSGGQSLCLANNCGLYRTNEVVAAVCNDSTSSISAQNAWAYINVNNGAWNYTNPVTLVAGNKIRWTILPSSNSKRYAAIGSSAAGVGYRLRTGTLFLF
ncbi:MAG TPA: hypothetical protein VIM73_13000 [Polyangiaceae bacterium]